MGIFRNSYTLNYLGNVSFIDYCSEHMHVCNAFINMSADAVDVHKAM